MKMTCEGLLLFEAWSEGLLLFIRKILRGDYLACVRKK